MGLILRALALQHGFTDPVLENGYIYEAAYLIRADVVGRVKEITSA